MNEDAEQDDEIIELNEIVQGSTDEKETDMIIELTDIETDSACREEKAEVPELSREMVESALEKVIEKQFSGKIETILFQVMERVIEKEIKEIRDSLQKDLDRIGTA